MMTAPGEGWLKGWVCPECNGVWAPLQRGCPKCNKEESIYFVIPEDKSLTPIQIREMQDALRAVAAELKWRHKLIVLPPSKIISEWNI